MMDPTHSWRARTTHATDIAWLTGLLGLALVVYQPWHAPAFSITDYSEFIPILQRSTSFGDHVADLVRYFRGHGRSAVLTYIYIAANWTLFGNQPLGWEVTQFALMYANVILIYVFLRNLKLAPFAAGLGAALVIVSFAALAAWVRLTGEMISLLAFVAAAIVALKYQTSRTWVSRAILLSLLVLIAVAAKEMAVMAVPTLLLFAISWHHPEGLRRFTFSRRNLGLVGGVAIVLLPLAVFILQTAGTASGEGYVQSYGNAGFSAGRMLDWYLKFLLPVPTRDPSVFVVSATAFGLIVLGGWRLRAAAHAARARTYAEFLLLLTLPAFGAMAYLPWPRFEGFYALPFLPAAVLLVAVGASELQRRSTTHALAALILAGMLIIPMAAHAHNSAQVSKAVRRLDGVLIDKLVQLRPGRVLVVAVRGLPAQPWQSKAAALQRTILATGVSPEAYPNAQDITCTDAFNLTREQAENFVFVTLGHHCGTLEQPTASVETSFRYLIYQRLQFTRPVLRADVRLPADIALP